MTRISTTAFALAAILALSACSAATEITESETAEPDAAACGAICVVPFDGSQVDVDTWAGVAYEEGVVILDVRTPEEFADGHIAGATNINLLSGVFADEIALLNPEASYAVYCRSGNRSREAIDIMADLGVTQTLGLEDGIGGWAAAGYAIVTD